MVTTSLTSPFPCFSQITRWIPDQSRNELRCILSYYEARALGVDLFLSSSSLSIPYRLADFRPPVETISLPFVGMIVRPFFLFRLLVLLSLVPQWLQSFHIRQHFVLAEASHASSFTKRDPVPAGYVSPPYYPTPKGGWVAEWAASYAKAQSVVANMTLAEKVNLTTGTGLYMVGLIVEYR